MWATILSAFIEDIRLMDVILLVGIVWVVRSQANFKELLKAKLEPIEKALSNHVTETRAEIRLLSDRLDRLYELLLKRQNKNSDKDKKD